MFYCWVVVCLQIPVSPRVCRARESVSMRIVRSTINATVQLLIGASGGALDFSLGLSPGLTQAVKTLLTVRCKFIVPDPGTDLGWACR